VKLFFGCGDRQRTQRFLVGKPDIILEGAHKIRWVLVFRWREPG
jgi:hypothetical protein